MIRKNHKKRKICVVTGTRAEYGLLRPILHEIKKNKNLKLQLLVTGMHLSSDFGKTMKYILNDGFAIAAKVPMTSKGDSAYDMARSIGTGIMGMSKTFNKLKSDVALVLGDRAEALAASVAATYSGIHLAHIHGGDSAEAGLDENTRHAITKLAHIHFPATKKSAERIIKMGEDKTRVFITGAPGLDDIEKKKFLSPKEISEMYGLDLTKPIILTVQHPVTTQVEDAPRQIKETLKAIINLRLQTIILYPNSDAGGRTMIKVIESYSSKYPQIKMYKSVPRNHYLGLLNVASVLVGNSSSGIIESPSFHIPVVDIGTRQKGRESSSNIISVGYNSDEIIKAINKSLKNNAFLKKVKAAKNPYSGKNTGFKITKILSNISLDSRLLKKKNTY